MLIHEAAEKAAKYNCFMVRGSVEQLESRNCGRIMPTNTYNACLLFTDELAQDVLMRKERTARFWAPTLDDLTADDWKVVDMSWAEVPEETDG